MSSSKLTELVGCLAQRIDGDEIDTTELVLEFSREVNSLTEFGDEKDFQLSLNAARAIAAARLPQPIVAALKCLLDVSFATISRGRSLEGFELAERAILLSREHGLKQELRRAFSVYGILNTDSGMPAKGVEYALHALILASSIRQPQGEAAAQANLAAALHVMGLHRECIEVCYRLIDRYDSDDLLVESVAASRFNLAASALTIGEYRLAQKIAMEGIERLRALRGSAYAFLKFFLEIVCFKCAIRLGKQELARNGLERLRAAESMYSTPRTRLNLSLVEAEFEVHLGHCKAALSLLPGLLEASRSMPPLYRDVLSMFVRVYETAGDRANALLYLGKLVNFVAKMQTDNLERALSVLQIKAQTPIPGKDDVREVLAAIQRSDSLPRKNIDISIADVVATYETFALTAELKEDSSGRQMYRVGRLARLLAEAVGKSETLTESIEHAARLHDIGKLGLPDEVILAAGKLTPEQHQAMQMHCEIGAKMIDQSGHPSLALAREVAMSHHERWDGTGYPQKLKGDAIPLSARIASIAEVYDVLTHERTYREGDAHVYTHEAAVALMQSLAGTQFDPSLMTVFVKLINELRQQHSEDLDNFLAIAGSESTFLQAKDEMARLVDSL